MNEFHYLIFDAIKIITRENEDERLRLYAKFHEFRLDCISKKLGTIDILKSRFFNVSSCENSSIFDILLFNCFFGLEICFEGEYEFANEYLFVNKFSQKLHFLYNREIGRFQYTRTVQLSENSTELKSDATKNLTKLSERLLKTRNLFQIHSFLDYKLNSLINSIDTKNIRNLHFNKCQEKTQEHNYSERNFETEKLDLSLMNLMYDIDGIYGTLGADQLDCFKLPLTLRCSEENEMKPINKSCWIKLGNSLLELKDFVTLMIGNFHFNKDENLKFYIVFEIERLRLNPEMEKKIKRRAIDEILNFYKTKSNETEFHETLSYSEASKVLTGLASLNIFKIIFENLRKILNCKMMIYFESYGTKDFFVSQNIPELIKKLECYFNLSTVILCLDICCRINLKSGNYNKVLSMSCSLFDRSDNINQYSLFNCYEFSNYHERTTKEHENSLRVKYSGIDKINIYTPLINRSFNRNATNIKFPKHTSTLAMANLYGFSSNRQSKKSLKTLSMKLDVISDNLNSFICKNSEIRIEFSVNSLNVISFESFIRDELSGIRLNIFNHDVLRNLLISGVNNFKSVLLRSPSEHTIFSLAKVGIEEIAFFENFVRGGNNLHILPEEYKEFFQQFKSHEKVRLITTEYIEEKNLVFNDALSICKKLLKIDILTQTQSQDIAILINVIVENNLLHAVNTLLNQFLRYLRDKHNIISDDLLVSSEIRSKNRANPISFNEFYADFFTYSLSDSNLLYIGIYKYISATYTDVDIYQIVKSRFIDMKVQLLPKKNKDYRVLLYQVNFLAEDLSLQLEELIMIIKENISFGTKYAKVSVPVRGKEISISEKIIVYYIFFKERKLQSYTVDSITKSIKYPFYLMGRKSRFESIKRNLKNSADSLEIYFKQTCNIQWDVTKIIRFLNANNFFALDLNTIKNIDRVNHIAIDREFIPQSDSFYNNIFLQQKFIKNDYKFLFENLNTNTAIPNSIISEYKVKDELQNEFKDFSDTEEKAAVILNASQKSKAMIIYPETVFQTCNFARKKEKEHLLNTSVSIDLESQSDFEYNCFYCQEKVQSPHKSISNALNFPVYLKELSNDIQPHNIVEDIDIFQNKTDNNKFLLSSPKSRLENETRDAGISQFIVNSQITNKGLLVLEVLRLNAERDVYLPDFRKKLKMISVNIEEVKSFLDELIERRILPIRKKNKIKYRLLN
jgi:hypothetical protein